MRVIVDIRRAAADERGGVLVMVAIWMPVLIVVITFAIDMSNWFQHKRHLQMQADAGALAAMQEVLFDCDDATAAAAEDAAARYSGTQYNAQIGGTPPSRVVLRVNRKTFHDQAGTSKPQTPDDTVEASVCDASMIDVKLTETDLEWFFPPFEKLIGGSGFGDEDVDFVNARARVSFLRQDTAHGSLPVGVPDVNPKVARAWFLNESSGAVLGSTPLTKVGTSNGLAVWDNADAPLPLTFGSGDVDVGVVIALGGGSSTTCGQPLVECFDAGATTLADGMPSKGIVYVRGWSSAGSGAQPNSPILREATLLPGTCADPYFSSATTTCRFGVRARVDFGTGDPVGTVGASVTARVGGTAYPLTYNAASQVWSVDAAIPLAAGAGPVNVALDWAETSGTWNGNTCSTGNNNKCKGTFGAVQRAFAASGARSGPIQVAQVWKDGVQWANAVERCSSVQTSCTHNMVVRIGIKGSLGNAASVDDPAVALRVVGGSQNQSLDCDPAKPSLVDELATGCAPAYTRNTGAPCPSSNNTLWATPQPWPCVGIATGTAVNQVPRGLNLRIYGTEQPSSCTSPNRWSTFPNLDPADPRLVQVLLTPYGAFGGNGSTTVPVTDFATFYITGWAGQGGGFTNPCQGNGDDPAEAGYIVGHFVKYIASLNPPGTGTTPCDLSAFGSCFAELTH